MRMLILLALLAGVARAEAPDAGVTYPSLGSSWSGHLVLTIPGELPANAFARWPATCHLVFDASGDFTVVGEDVEPCAEKLETAACSALSMDVDEFAASYGLSVDDLRDRAWDALVEQCETA